MAPEFGEERIVIVRLNLNSKSGGAAKELWFSERAYAEGELYSGSPIVFGALDSVSGLGQTMGEVLPNARRGGVVIDNTRGTLRHDLRLSDYLEAYAFIKSRCRVYTFVKPPGSAGSGGNMSLLADTRIEGVHIDVQANTLDLEIETSTLSEARMNYVITQEREPNAPQASMGRGVPVVFGEGVEVKPVALTSPGSGESGAYWAYGTTFYSTFRNQGVDTVYVRNRDGEYQEFDPVANTSTPIFDWSPVLEAGKHVFTIPWDSNRVVEQTAFRLQPGQNCNPGQIIIGASWYVYMFEWDYPNEPGEFSCRVFDNKGELPGKEITGDSIIMPDDVSKTTEVPEQSDGGTPEIYVPRHIRLDFHFQEPVVIPDTNPIFISFSHNVTVIENGGGFFVKSIAWPLYIEPVGSPFEKYIKYLGSSDFTREVFGPSLWRECFTVWGAAFSDQPSPSVERIDSRNIGYSRFAITRRAQSAPDMAKLEVVAVVNGLRDANNGLVTGTPNQVITRPHHAVKMLYAAQNNFSTSGFDEGASGSAVTVNIHGHTEETLSFRDGIADILSAFSMKLLPQPNGTLKLWAFGQQETTSEFIDEGDSVLLSVEVPGTENIVNEISLAYDRRALPLSLLELQRDITIPNAYAKGTLFAPGEPSAVGEIVSRSLSLYGRREAARQFAQIDWFAADEAARRYADYVFRWHGYEPYIATLRVPLFRYRDIPLFDIVALSHIDNFSIYGSDPESTAKLPRYDDEAAENFNFRYPWRRAKRHWFRVLAIDPVFHPGGDEPELVFTLRQVNRTLERV